MDDGAEEWPVDTLPDYDNVCEALGIRIQQSDATVKALLAEIKSCTRLLDARDKMCSFRAQAGAEEKYLTAFICGVIIQEIDTLRMGE